MMAASIPRKRSRCWLRHSWRIDGSVVPIRSNTAAKIPTSRMGGDHMSLRFNRREALRSLTLGATGSSLAAGVARAGETAPAATVPAPASQPAGICVLFPQAVEGPYYFDPKLVRSDIAEGRPGLPLDIKLTIIESGPCTPIVNARVDVWHADAGGVYSGYGGQGDQRNVSTKGDTYLRGTQATDAIGVAKFRSVFPGWYPGRTPHIHVKVFLDEKTALTGQVYFADDLATRIYREREPYKSRPVQDTTNSTDFIFKSGEREGGGTVLTASDTGDTVSSALIIAVDRSGAATRTSGRWLDWLRGLAGSR